MANVIIVDCDVVENIKRGSPFYSSSRHTWLEMIGNDPTSDVNVLAHLFHIFLDEVIEAVAFPVHLPRYGFTSDFSTGRTCSRTSLFFLIRYRLLVHLRKVSTRL